MSTGQGAVTLSGWGAKQVWFIPLVDKHVGGPHYHVPYLNALERSFS